MLINVLVNVLVTQKVEIVEIKKGCTNYCKSRISGTYHSHFQKVQFTEDNRHLSVSNSLLYVQIHYFQITVHVQ